MSDGGSNQALGSNQSGGDSTYKSVLESVLLLKNEIDVSCRRQRFFECLYDFEKDGSSQGTVHIQQQSNAMKDDLGSEANLDIPSKATSRLINAWRYFNTIRNLPLYFLLNNSNKLVYCSEYLVMSRELDDIRIFKKIEKLRRKGALVVDMEVEDDSEGDAENDVPPENHSAIPSLSRVGDRLFKKRRLVIATKQSDEKERPQNRGRSGSSKNRKEVEMLRFIQKVSSRSKRDHPVRREANAHPSYASIINKIPSDVKHMTKPIDFMTCVPSSAKGGTAEKAGNQRAPPNGDVERVRDLVGNDSSRINGGCIR